MKINEYLDDFGENLCGRCKMKIGRLRFFCESCTENIRSERDDDSFVEKKYVGNAELGYIDHRTNQFVITNRDLFEMIREEKANPRKKK